MKKQKVTSTEGEHEALVRRLNEVMDEKHLTARGWSTSAGLKPDAIRNIVRGRSEQPRMSTLEALAGAVGVSVEYLRARTDEPGSDTAEIHVGEISEAGTLPLIGYIGAGETVYHFGISEAHDRVPAPPDVKRGIAAVVRGNSMFPVYRDDDLMIGTEHQGPIDALVGLDCLVQVQDGPLYLKKLRKGTKGRFNLESYNPAVPVIQNQVVEWAAPIAWVKRKR